MCFAFQNFFCQCLHVHFFDFFYSVLIFLQIFQIVDYVKRQCMFYVSDFCFLSMFARIFFRFFSFCFDFCTEFSNY